MLKRTLAGRARQEIIAAHDVCDTLCGIVDHDRQVVRGDAVVSLQHDVVTDARVDAGDQVVHREALAIGGKADRRPSTRCHQFSAAPRRERAAGTGVRGLRQLAHSFIVRGTDGLADLPTCAVAVVHAAVGPQPRDCGVVELEPFRLANDLPIGVQPEGSQRPQLVGFIGSRGGDAVQVLHPYQPFAAQRAGV